MLHFDAVSLGAAIRYETETIASLKAAGLEVFPEDLTLCGRCDRLRNAWSRFPKLRRNDINVPAARCKRGAMCCSNWIQVALAKCTATRPGCVTLGVVVHRDRFFLRLAFL
jgi:hypothetical protein